MSLLSPRACIWKCSFPPFGAANGPWNEVAPVLFSCLCPQVFRCVGVAPEVSQPHPGRSLAGDFSRIRYWPVSGTPDAAREKGERWDCRGLFFIIIINLSKKQMSSFYLRVPFCFILCKGSNKYLAACEKQSLWYLHRKCMPLLVWFSLYVVKGTEGGRGRKSSSEEWCWPVCLRIYSIESQLPAILPARQRLAISGDIFWLSQLRRC